MNFVSADNKEFLTYSDFQDNTDVEGVCYVVKVDNSISAIDSPYYRLIVRTVDGMLVPCVVFNIDDFNTLGYKLNFLKNKYIRLKASVREFNSKYSLRFLSLKLHEDVTPELTMKFMRSVENLDDYYSDLVSVFSQFVDDKFPSIIKSKSYPELYKGYMGGYVKFSWEMMINCQAAASDIEQQDFMKILFYTLIHYNEYLDKVNFSNLVTDSDRIDMVSRIPIDGHTSRLIRETFSCLIGLTKPNHLVPVIIVNAFEYIVKMRKVKDDWEMLRPGGVSECEGLKLIKY